jgi:iron complex outermembrane receptor protein/hemoglobin/transferrin/lactoferrin receptor protein
LVLLTPISARADQGIRPPIPDDPEELADAPAEIVVLEPSAESDYSSTIVATRSRQAIVEDHRAVSVIDGETFREMAPRSTSAALHLLPGVSVQRTNHAGGSPFIRGRTGQQTLILIDGFRLNTSIMRSGPNQYLNTIDPAVVGRVEVLRGAGAVLYGSDAIGGVVNIISRAPIGGRPSLGLQARGATAEQSLGARGELDAGVAGARVLAGVSMRSFGDLRGAGPLALTPTPVYEGDTQLFTGYDEVAFDAKASYSIGRRGQVTAAFFAFRQLDAPRTDKCTPDPLDCRVFEEQYYDLGYVRYRGAVAGLEDVEVGAAVARTHEQRARTRVERDLTARERDRVLTFALTGRASAPKYERGDSALRISFGGEVYFDKLASEATNVMMSTGERTALARGKYLDGSSYLSAAGFAFAEAIVDRSLSVTGGARLNAIRGQVARDPESSTPGFTLTELVPVFGIGVRVALTEHLALVGNANQSFRAPNLDDLTARSSEGPGFQLPNTSLGPERGVGLDAGVQVRHRRGLFEAFAFQSFVDDSIERVATSCPTELQAQCGDADNVYRLTNAESSVASGIEVGALIVLPEALTVRGSLTWTRVSTLLDDAPPQPGSKVPPLSGEVGVRMDFGKERYFIEGVAHFATRQDRLSPSDRTDRRIPVGGTPGYGILDLRGGARIGSRLRALLTLENLTNSPYRVHGSGVDGAGFGAILTIQGNTAAL